jgi:hypothetical protein
MLLKLLSRTTPYPTILDSRFSSGLLTIRISTKLKRSSNW